MKRPGMAGARGSTGKRLPRGRLLAAAVIVAGIAGMAASRHVDRYEDSLVVITDTAVYDPVGMLQDSINRLTRSCSSVSMVPAGSPQSRAVTLALGRAGLPDAQLLRVARMGDWFEAEVQFPALEPAIFLINERDQKLIVHADSAWSGSTGPLEPGPLIRKYFAAHVPGAPPALLECFEPSLDQFR